MGWIGNLIGGTAAIIATPQRLEQINQQNKQIAESYKANEIALTMTQELNRDTALQVTDALSQDSTIKSRELGIEQQQKDSKEGARRTGGVLSGNSASRSLVTSQLQNSKETSALEKSAQDGISKMYQNMETDNFRLQQQKRSAWNQANGAIKNRDEAVAELETNILAGFGG